jgi:acyl-[acyl-carrier-protein]-phospholipid O-acyltransferase / long-chain-fatty-acid--[acyl-carrier-protein] ligase
MTDSSKTDNNKGFIPYLMVVFLNAFVDLGHKIVIQNAIFKSYDGQEQVVLTAIINGLILLPFILLFSPAGFLADKFAKHRIIRHSALFAVIATGLITFCYYQGWFWAAFGLTFALGVQSAIYSPAKYGYIKELVGNERLAAVNGVVQAITIAGILLGTLVFSLLFEGLLPDAGTASTGDTLGYIAPIGWVLVALATLEWAATAFLPARQPGAGTGTFRMQPYLKLHYLRSNLGVLGHNNTIWLSIIGLATFWAISQVMLAAFPAFAKEALDITNTVVIQGILACSGIGIVLGSLLAGKASRNYIETGLIPVGALGIAIGIAALPGLGSAYSMGVAFLLVGVMGGIFIVPLNALIQFQARKEQLGTVLAGNNWIQNVAMMSALMLTVVFSVAGIGSVGLFYLLTGVAIIGTGYTVRKLPHSLARILATAILKRRYRLEVIGFDNIPQAGATLLLGNHISWIDWALVQIACPRPIRFVMLKRIYETWYLRPFFKVFGVVPISAGQSKESLATINELLKAGECVCLFPEGAISRNGHLGKFHSGYERALEGLEEGMIVPFYLHGLWGSSLSRADEGLRNARSHDIRRDLIIAFGAPLPLETRASQLKQKVFELSLIAWDTYSKQLDPVPLAWLRTARRNPGSQCVADTAGTRLRNDQMVSSVACLGRQLRLPRGAPNVGVLLPASADAAMAIMAIALRGGVVVPLNYSAPGEVVRSAIRKASIRQVLTSRGFVEHMRASGTDLDSLLREVSVSYMEDMQKAVPGWRRVLARLQLRILPATWLYRLWGRRVDAEDPAAILFSADPENPTRAVVLSHRNIMTNCKQASDVLNTAVDDVMMSSLPPCHPLGLTLTTLMPLVEGIPMACHADPTDSLGIARAVARYSATLLPGLGSTLGLYVENAEVHRLMLDPVRLVVAGAGSIAEEVRRAFELKFGKPVYQGYGLAETSAAATANIPDAMDVSDWKVQQGNITGTLGMPLPGTSLKVVDRKTGAELALGQEGRVLIGGSQVMLSYLNEPDKTAAAISADRGQRWFNTARTGHLTAEGFLVLNEEL